MVIKDFDELYGVEIPDSWSVEKLEPKIGNVKSGKRLPKGFYVTDMHTNHPYIRVIDMREGYVDTRELKYVPDEAFAAIQNYRIYKDDIYISVAGTLGIVGQIPEYLDGANLTENANRITNIKCNIKYLMYWLMSSAIQNIISQTQTLGAQPKLALTRIRNFPVILPPIQEQRKIVEALSDIDSLLLDLQKLIRKKKNIRQGTMQVLVTGKTRMPGHNGDFVKVSLGDLGSLSKTSVNPSQEPRTIFEEYSMPAFDDGEKPNQVMGEFMLSSRIRISSDTLLFNKLNVRQRRVWYIRYCGENAVCSSEFLPYKSDKINLSFLKQLLLTDKVTQDFEDMSSGTSNSQQRITPADFLKYEISVPSLHEQGEIAVVIEDMDLEIQRLEEKLSKYQKVKQGMMEELLTGKVRLV